MMVSRAGSVDPSKFADETFDLYSIPAFDSRQPKIIDGREIGSTKQVVCTGDVLLSKIVPHIRRSWVVGASRGRRLIASGEWIVFRDPRVEPAYLCHVVIGDPFHSQFMQTVSGVGGSLLRARPAHVAKIEIPLPPLAEQRRIAAILDQAETLRTQRRAAIAQLDSLGLAIFLEMFGDLELKAMRWPVECFQKTLAMPLHNGLSPSKSGKVVAKVLTLSAVTGAAFDATAWKESTFETTPPGQKAVDARDFLICRGNGNLNLVGRGKFPPASMANTTFPDTMIAARVDPSRVERGYLQFVWHSIFLRRQVESAARTTNGTFKVNQTMLEEMRIPLPPIELQRKFGRFNQSIERLRADHQAALSRLDELFASLQHRAFRGEL
nr:restriction endonuclease subunit S [Variovorax sp. dw_954]